MLFYLGIHVSPPPKKNSQLFRVVDINSVKGTFHWEKYTFLNSTESFYFEIHILTYTIIHTRKYNIFLVNISKTLLFNETDTPQMRMITFCKNNCLFCHMTILDALQSF